MSKAENKIMRRRLMNAYLSSVISISLVLLLVGVASMLLVNAKSVSDYFKENMQVSVLMKQNVSDEKALEFKERLESERYIKSTTFISKEQGQRELAAQLGDHSECQNVVTSLSNANSIGPSFPVRGCSLPVV